MANARTLTIRSGYDLHRIGQAAAALREGGVVLFPTDTIYALGCDPAHKDAIARLRAIKPQLGARHLTLMCGDLSMASRYGYLDDAAFKLIRALAPGPFVFLLRGTKEVPRLVMNPKRKEAGIRIPKTPICQALLEQAGGLLVTTSASLPDDAAPQSHWDLFEHYGNLVDLIVDDERELETEPSTIIDLTGAEFRIAREGKGLAEVAPYINP